MSRGVIAALRRELKEKNDRIESQSATISNLERRIGVLEHAAAQEPSDEWTAFELCTRQRLPDGTVIDLASLNDPMMPYEIYRNNLYQVSLYRPQDIEGVGRVQHLSMKRNDNTVIRDWRHLQLIKNEIIGEEVEAVEIFPAESRMTDMANQYHLWCFLDSHIPFGFSFEGGRNVSEDMSTGNAQRPFHDSRRPDDCGANDEERKRLTDQFSDKAKQS